MPQFRVTQISDPHLARNQPRLIDNFCRVSDYIDATRPDLVINSGDIAFDGPGHRDDLEFARTMHDALPVTCRYLPGNHDIGDNPTKVGAPPPQPVTEETLQAFVSVFGEERWRFDEAGWCFIGLNSQVMNTGLGSEAEQWDWLASQLADVNGKPVALFLHKPPYLNAPDDPELAATSVRYVPMPARSRLIEMFDAVDLRLVASGHVHQRRDFTFKHIRHIWAPSIGYLMPDSQQPVIGSKEVGLMEYRFQPDSFEVRHIRASGLVDLYSADLASEG